MRGRYVVTVRHDPTGDAEYTSHDTFESARAFAILACTGRDPAASVTISHAGLVVWDSSAYLHNRLATPVNASGLTFGEWVYIATRVQGYGFSPLGLLWANYRWAEGLDPTTVGGQS